MTFHVAIPLPFTQFSPFPILVFFDEGGKKTSKDSGVTGSVVFFDGLVLQLCLFLEKLPLSFAYSCGAQWLRRRFSWAFLRGS